jgi:hypothetical protein
VVEYLRVFCHVGFFRFLRRKTLGIQARKVSMSLLMEVMRCYLPPLLLLLGVL